MRYALAAALILFAAPATAEPWAKHPDLGRSETDMTETPDAGPSGERTAKAYFERLEGMGFSCDAADTALRKVLIKCDDRRGHTIVYRGQFVGVGYLELDQATVDGRRLDKGGLVNHQTSVWNGELRIAR